MPNSRYDNDYEVGNLGEISHLLKSDNRTMTNNWYSYLRGINFILIWYPLFPQLYIKKKILKSYMSKKKSVSPVDIRKTEKKLF